MDHSSLRVLNGKGNHYFLLLALSIILVATSCNSGQKPVSKTIGNIDTLKRNEVANPYTTSDQSPMDMCYYPRNYPVLKMNSGADSFGLISRVIYSRPQKKGRVIFGYSSSTLCQYGKEWRLGANEATEIEFFTDVSIGKEKVKKGRYILYCIPYSDHWTVVLNANLFTWGLHMDKSKDILRTDIPVASQSPIVEDFTMIFEAASYGTDLSMAWDNVKAVLPIKVIL